MINPISFLLSISSLFIFLRILQKKIKPDDLISGDRNALLVSLRITGYGADYDVEVDCPECGTKSKQTFDLSHMHNILFVSVTVQMLFSLGAVFNYYSVFDTVLDTDTVGAISGSFTNTIFFLYGMYAYLLVRTDKRRGNQLSNRTQTVGIIFAVIIIPVQALTLFGIIPAAAFAGLFVLGGVILYPLFILGVGDAIGNYSVE